MVGYLFTVDKPSLKIDFSFFKQKGIGEMLMFGILLSLSSIASLGLKTLDSVVMGKYLPLTFVGIYAIASFIPTIIETPLYALDKIVTARIAHAASENNMDEIRDVYYKSVKYLSLIGALLFVGINCNITYLLHLIGKGFQQGIEVVWIISIGSLINMMGGANTSIIFYSSKYWHGAVLLLLLVVITLISNILLIPRFGINGAAMSTAISSLLYTAIKLVLINRKFKFQPYNINTLKVIGIGIVCIGINYLLPEYESNILNIMMHSSVIGVTFLVLTYVLKIAPEFHRYIPIKKLK
jgi:O-antigen/teichoic acid export membrane protein